MAFLVFQDGKLKREYSTEELQELILAKAKIHPQPEEWAYWTDTKTWFVANPDQRRYSYIVSLNQVPKEYQAIVLLYL